MCLLLSNPTANKSIVEICRLGQSNLVHDIARMADEDTVEEGKALGSKLKNVSDWSSLEISNVKKYRRGRHRFYIVGNHTQCQYKVVFVLVNKREEDDKPDDKRFQNKIARAVMDDSYLRIIEPPR